jgi:flagellar hook-associated protein 2
MATTTATSGLSASTASALSSTPAAIAAANKANAQKILTSMGAGSGVDTASLAQNLVDAERVPQQNSINGKITKNESRISGYSAISFIMNELKNKFDVLKVKSDFNTMTVDNSQSSSITVQPDAYATTGATDVQVLSIAKPQRTLSGGFAAASETLNSGNPFQLSLSIGSAAAVPIAISAANATPAGVVSAINSAGLAVKAQLVTTGIASTAAVASVATIPQPSFGSTPSTTDFTGFSISVGGQTLNANNLSPATADLAGLAAAVQAKLRAADGNTSNISVAVVGSDLQVTDASGRAISNVVLTGSSNAGVSVGNLPMIQNGSVAAKNSYKIMLTGVTGVANSFSMTSPVVGLSFGSPMQSASDASLVVNGLSMSRSSNTVTDIIPGSTVTLKAPTIGASTVTLGRDVSSVKTKLTDMVTAWNDAQSLLKEVSDPKSTLDTYGATLVGDSTVRRIQQQLRDMVMGSPSSPATNAAGLWQLGISITQTGQLTVDNTKLDAELQNNYDDVVKLFTNDKNLFLSSTTDAAGIGGDAVKKITALLGPNGPMLQQTQTATTQNTKYKDDLTKLQLRMDNLLKRYTTQFGAMQSMVGQTNSMKASLKSSFDGMMATYTNK